MQEIKAENITHAKLQSDMKKCSCGCPFFIDISINTFRDIPQDLYDKNRSFNPENLYMLECLQCKKVRIPSYAYFGLKQEDLKLIKYLNEIIEARNKNES